MKWLISWVDAYRVAILFRMRGWKLQSYSIVPFKSGEKAEKSAKMTEIDEKGYIRQRKFNFETQQWEDTK